MIEDTSPQVLLSNQFASFEELAEKAVGWDFEFRQISKNYSVTTLDQILAGNLMYTHLTSGSFAIHDGAAPHDMFTVCIPDRGCPEFHYADKVIDRPVMIGIDSDKEFHLAARPGYGMSTFSIPLSIIDEHCENYFGSTSDKLLQHRKWLISITTEMAKKFHSLAQSISATSQASSQLRHQFKPIQSFESQLLECLYDSFDHKEIRYRKFRTTARKRMLARALEFIGDNENEPLNVQSLVEAVGTSERTLQRLFHHVYGISPKKYLLGQRMYGVHRELWRSSPSEKRIVDIANAWGFWHMGQFAADYRRLYGELPSVTLKRFTS